ncbi:MAG TPA: phage protease [Gemmatimonadaceae bacterium]|nr:phage protease [Gemmatimonadaceae bacterium]
MNPTDHGRALHQLAQSLMHVLDPELVVLARTNPTRAYREALIRAARIHEQGEAALAAATLAAPAPAETLRADEQLDYLAKREVQRDPVLSAQAATDWRGAYRIALTRIVRTDAGAALHALGCAPVPDAQRPRCFSRSPLRLSGAAVADGLAADGSIWSHAATFGDYVYGGETMAITPATVRNFLRVFASGYPQKVPVDYEHDTARLTGDAKQPGAIPKAGDILELAAVERPADLNPAMQLQVEKAGRAVDDPRNLGLWVRWRPTPRALQLLHGREYSEMSITWYEDYPHNQTGAAQGPTIVSVALTNTPFLDGMVPIALTLVTPGIRAAA